MDGTVMPDRDQGKMLELAGLAAQIILENGAETYRVEDTVLQLCQSYGFNDAGVLALSTGVLISVSHTGHSSAIIRRVRKRGMNLMRVNEVNALSRRIANGGIGMEDALASLRDIAKADMVTPLGTFTMAGLSAGCFALMFGGGALEFVVALVCGALSRVFAHAVRHANTSLVLVSLFGGIICASVTMAAHFIFPQALSVESALTGAIIPLVSGLMMTNAVRDTLRGDLLSGMARSMEALLVSIMVALGVSSILSLYVPGAVDTTLAQSSVWYRAVLFAGLGTMCFCPLLRVPIRAILPSTLLGSAAHGCFLLLRDVAGFSELLALFIASALIAWLCGFLARHLKMIATVFLSVALLPLVPGLRLFRTMQALLLGNYVNALLLGFQTLGAVVAIALGVALGSLRFRKASARHTNTRIIKQR